MSRSATISVTIFTSLNSECSKNIATQRCSIYTCIYAKCAHSGCVYCLLTSRWLDLVLRSLLYQDGKWVKTVLTEDVKDVAGPDRVGVCSVPLINAFVLWLWGADSEHFIPLLNWKSICIFPPRIESVHALLGSVGRGCLRGQSRHGLLHAYRPGSATNPIWLEITRIHS